MKHTRIVIALGLALALSACASQIDAGISAEPDSPGFLWGLWHGFIFPWSFIGSLFSGMGVLVARYAGAGDAERVNQVASQVFFLSLWITLGIFAPVGYLLSPILLVRH